MLPEEILKLRETIPAYCCSMFPLLSLQEARGTRTTYFEVQAWKQCSGIAQVSYFATVRQVCSELVALISQRL